MPRMTWTTLCFFAALGALCCFWNKTTTLKRQYERCEIEYQILRERLESGLSADTEMGLWDILSLENPDFTGWIRVEGTGIDYPVVRTWQPEYYLTHTFSGEEGVSGTLFIRQPGVLAEADHLIIFGHNMRDGSMFGNLKAYAKTAFEDHREISLNIEGKWYFYQAVAAYKVGADESWPYVYEFSTDSSRRRYSEKILSLAAVENQGMEFAHVQWLTLSTCSGNRRFLLTAVRPK